jgi:hypothetical protein
MMDQDISKIIELIDKKIKALTLTKQTLINEFGNGGRYESFIHNEHKGTNKKSSRKDTVEKLLREQGSMSRKEIIEKTGFPTGTIAFVLNDKERFVSKNGKWHVVDKRED